MRQLRKYIHRCVNYAKKYIVAYTMQKVHRCVHYATKYMCQLRKHTDAHTTQTYKCVHYANKYMCSLRKQIHRCVHYASKYIDASTSQTNTQMRTLHTTQTNTSMRTLCKQIDASTTQTNIYVHSANKQMRQLTTKTNRCSQLLQTIRCVNYAVCIYAANKNELCLNALIDVCTEINIYFTTTILKGEY